MFSPSRKGPGSTMRAPTMGPAAAHAQHTAQCGAAASRSTHVCMNSEARRYPTAGCAGGPPVRTNHVRCKDTERIPRCADNSSSRCLRNHRAAGGGRVDGCSNTRWRDRCAAQTSPTHYSPLKLMPQLFAWNMGVTMRTVSAAHDMYTW